jgi:hypothetical protein
MPLLRKSCLCLFAVSLAILASTTGCRDHHHDRQDESQPAQSAAQPAQDETVIYNNWEAETHRAHKDLSQRTADEQREYREWRAKH